jgi:hypothetical protein
MSARNFAPRPPLDWFKARLRYDKTSPTWFVWLDRPRSDFGSESAYGVWRSQCLGKPAGVKGASAPRISVTYRGASFIVDVRALARAYETGVLPLRSAGLDPWTEPWREPSLKEPADKGVLADFLDRMCAGQSRKALTVLSRDPFALSGPLYRQAAEWFVECFDDRFSDRLTHLREVHYVLSQARDLPPKPNGGAYLNTFKHWKWLTDVPAKAARWLGLLPFDSIIDNRSEPPTRNRPSRAGEPEVGSLLTELPVPEEVDVAPTPSLESFAADQPYCYAAFCEKSSAKAMLDPICARFGINLHPSTGDAVETAIWQIAHDANEDGRKLIVFTVSDCDPAGHNMPIAIARKLQAHAVLNFHRLQFEVVRAGLTPDQARALELPSSPLKAAEKRADLWRERMGVGQIELDAALALKRAEFTAMIEAAIAPYFDSTLADRVSTARDEWEDEAEEAVEAQTNAEELEALQARYDAARAEIEAINDRLREIAEAIELPEPPEPPEPELTGERAPLIDSEWGFVEGTLRLKSDRAYEGDDDAINDDDEEDDDDDD